MEHDKAILEIDRLRGELRHSLNRVSEVYRAVERKVPRAHGLQTGEIVQALMMGGVDWLRRVADRRYEEELARDDEVNLL